MWFPPILAFLLGSIPFGLLIAKAKGVNIREHGSGNIGATNVLRVVGKKYGITCLILDLLKGLVPTLIGISLLRIEGKNPLIVLEFLEPHATIFPPSEALTAQILQVLTGLLAILGHNYSPWVGFKGGKGIATSAGVLIALMPVGVVVLIVIWAILFFTTRYVSVASIGASIALPFITLYGSYRHGYLTEGTWNKPLFIFSLIIAIMAVWKHRGNIRKLRAGTENRFSKK